MKRTLILVSWAMLTCIPVAFGDESAAAGTPAAPKEPSGEVFVVPMESFHGTPVVSVTINGKGPYRAIIDTGAGVSVFNDDLVAELNLPVKGRTTMGDPSDPDALEVREIRIDSIVVGGAVFSNIDAVAWDPGEHFRGSGIPRAILGLNVFAGYLTTFDFPNERFVLERGDLPAADGLDIIDFKYAHFHGEESAIPSIKVSLDGTTIDAGIDSGAPGEITLPTTMQHKLKLKSKPVVVGRAKTVNSEFDVLAATLDGNARIGRHVFEQPRVSFIEILDGVGEGNIGSGLLRQFSVTFDHKNKRVRFQRPSPQDPQNAAPGTSAASEG